MFAEGCEMSDPTSGWVRPIGRFTQLLFTFNSFYTELKLHDSSRHLHETRWGDWRSLHLDRKWRSACSGSVRFRLSGESLVFYDEINTSSFSLCLRWLSLPFKKKKKELKKEQFHCKFCCFKPAGVTSVVCFVHNIPGDFAGFPGCGLLRLHSTYRHDLKIYASDEGRVQMTAAAFAKVTLWAWPTDETLFMKLS